MVPKDWHDLLCCGEITVSLFYIYSVNHKYLVDSVPTEKEAEELTAELNKNSPSEEFYYIEADNEYTSIYKGRQKGASIN